MCVLQSLTRSRQRECGTESVQLFICLCWNGTALNQDNNLNMTMNREQAWTLVNEWTQAPHLIRHMLAVEAAMKAYARRFGEDEEKWGLVGLLHDFDYEKHPDLTVEGH